MFVPYFKNKFYLLLLDFITCEVHILLKSITDLQKPDSNRYIMYYVCTLIQLYDDRISIGGCLFVYHGIYRLMTGIHILTSGRIP